MSQLGKRYRCQACGTEILCTKAGAGNPVCCDKEMEIQEPKPLPSSDGYSIRCFKNKRHRSNG